MAPTPHRRSSSGSSGSPFARVALTALLCWSASACSSMPGLDSPEVRVQPEYYALQLRGDARMQTATPSGPRNNANIPMESFAIGERDDDYGGRIEFGDGFSGFDVSYLKLDMEQSERGTLTSDFGALEEDDVVRSHVEMDEWRLRYVAALWEPEFEEEFSAKVGTGAMVAHRRLRFRITEESDARAQQLAIDDDGVVYFVARARVDWRQWGGVVDFGYSPELDFGGDFNGTQQDLELRLEYRFEDQDVTVFGGYRRQEFEIDSSSADLAFGADLTLDGYMFGLRFLF